MSVDFFCTAVLPSVSKANLHQIKAALKSDDVFEGRHWKGFQKTPSTSGIHEGPTFLPLQGLIQRIIDAAQRPMESPVEMVSECNGSRKPYGQRDDSSRPDGWVKLRHTRGLPKDTTNSCWEDIFCFFEFKKHSSSSSRHDVRVFRLINRHLVHAVTGSDTAHLEWASRFGERPFSAFHFRHNDRGCRNQVLVLCAVARHGHRNV